MPEIMAIGTMRPSGVSLIQVSYKHVFTNLYSKRINFDTAKIFRRVNSVSQNLALLISSSEPK